MYYKYPFVMKKVHLSEVTSYKIHMLATGLVSKEEFEIVLYSET